MRTPQVAQISKTALAQGMRRSRSGPCGDRLLYEVQVDQRELQSWEALHARAVKACSTL